MQMYQAAELELVMLSYHSCIPNTPKFAALHIVGGFILFLNLDYQGTGNINQFIWAL